MLHKTHDSVRVNDHEVDRLTSSGVTTRTGRSSRSVQRDRRIETLGRNRDDPHIVVILNVVVDVVLAVHDSALNTALEVAVEGRIHAQDSALIGDFVVIHRSGCNIDCSNSTRRSRDGFGRAVNASSSGKFSKTVSIEFRDDKTPLEFAEQSAECKTHCLFIVHRINKERASSVDLDGVRIPRTVRIAGNKASVTIIVRKSDRVQFKKIYSFRARPTHKVFGHFKHTGKGFPGIHLVQHLKKLLGESDIIPNGSNYSCSHVLFSLVFKAECLSQHILLCLFDIA